MFIACKLPLHNFMSELELGHQPIVDIDDRTSEIDRISGESTKYQTAPKYTLYDFAIYFFCLDIALHAGYQAREYHVTFQVVQFTNVDT